MAKKERKNIKNQIEKITPNNEWLINVTKSLGFASMDVIKSLLPDTADFVSWNQSTFTDSMDMLKSVRENRSARNMFNKQFQNIPQIKIAGDIKNNLLKDLKSGKLYNMDREMGFGDDGEFNFDDMFDDTGVTFIDDDGDDSSDDSSSSSKPPIAVIDTMPLAKTMAASTEVTVNTMAAIADQQMAVETEKLMFDQRANQALLNAMSSMNNNLALLVQFNSDSTAKYQAASLEFYKEAIEVMKKPEEDEKKQKLKELFNPYTAHGGLKLDEYVKMVKKNIINIKDDSMVLSGIFDQILSPESLKDIAKNPMGMLLQDILQKRLSDPFQNSLKKLDKNLNAILPTLLAKVNTFEDADSEFLKTIYKTFGINNKISKDIDLGKYEKGPISWDGESKKALVEVIPAYLRRIESALTGEEERIFNFSSGKFTDINKLEDDYQRRLRDAEISGYTSSKTKMKEITRDYDLSTEAREQFEKDMEKMFSYMTNHGRILNHKNDKDDFIFGQLFDYDNNRINFMKNILSKMNYSDLVEMGTMGIADSQERTQRFYDEIRNNSTSQYAILNHDPTRAKYTGRQPGTRDEFGLSQLDYLRDIRAALIHGIKVFPDYGWMYNGIEPNSDIISKEKNEDNKVKEIKRQKQEREEDEKERRTANGRSIGEALEIMDWTQNAEEVAVDDERGKVTKAVDRVNSKIEKTLYNILYGETNYEEQAIEKLQEGYKKGKPLVEEFKGFFSDTIKSFKSFFTGQGYVTSDGVRVEGRTDSMMDKIKGFFTGARDKIKGENGEEGILQKFSKDFMAGYEKFKISLFGEKAATENQGKETMQDLMKKVKERLPKAIGYGFAGAMVKTFFASNLGILGNFLMPGGPLGAALMGTTFGFLKQSETFNKFVFGEKDEDGNRVGGIISKAWQDKYKENKDSIKKGAGLGILASMFLPGGPVMGAILGIGTSIGSKNEDFQKFLFGDNYKEQDKKSMMNGAFGKLFRKMGKGENDRDPELAKFLGGSGMAIGIAQGVGLLPSFLLPGGPIMGAILGMAAGITASSEKFQKFLLGDKDVDGKRYGGLLTKVTNWFNTSFMTPLKIKATEINDKIYGFMRRKVFDPLIAAFEPVTQALKFMVGDIKNGIVNAFHKITDPIVEGFKNTVINPIGKKLKHWLFNPIKKMFGLLGKSILGVLTAPLSGIKLIGNLADRYNERHVLRDEKRRRAQEFDESYTGPEIFRGINRRAATRMSKEEKENILNEELEYRHGKSRKERKKEQKEKYDEEMKRREEKRNEMQRQFEEDKAFGKSTGWKYASKKQKEAREQEIKEKQAWIQEQALLTTKETNEKVVKLADYLAGDGKILHKSEEKLRDIHETLKEGFKNLVDMFVNQNNKTNKDKKNKKSKNEQEDISETKHEAKVININDHLKKKGQSHADGLDEVPKDGYVAELHEGEMVVPKKPASKLRNMMGGLGNAIGGISNMFSSMFKAMKEDKRDRADNAMGLSEEEENRLKETKDQERREKVSRKDVDYVQNKIKERKEKKKEQIWKDSILANTLAIAQHAANAVNNKFSLIDLLKKGFSFVKGALGNLGSVLSSLAIPGAIAGMITSWNNYKDSEEYIESRTDVDADDDGEGDFIYDNTDHVIAKNVLSARNPLFIKPLKTIKHKLIDPVVNTGKSVYNTGKKVVTKGKELIYGKAATETVETATETAGKTIVKTSDDVIDFAATKAAKEAGEKVTGNMVDEALKKGSGKAVNKVIGGGNANLITKLVDAAKAALKAVADKIATKFPKVGNLAGKLVSKADDIFKTLLKNSDSLISRFGKKITAVFGEIGIGTATGGTLDVVFAVGDLVSGFTAGNAGNLFGVSPENVDAKMRIISSVLQTVTNFNALALISLVNEITSAMFNWNFLRNIAIWIYNLLPGDDLVSRITAKQIDSCKSIEEALQIMGITDPNDIAMLKDGNEWKDFKETDNEEFGGIISSTEQMELARLQYNLANGTNLSSQAFIDKESKTLGSKIWDGVTNIFKSDTAEQKINKLQTKADSKKTKAVEYRQKANESGNWFTKTYNSTMAWMNEKSAERKENKIKDIQENGYESFWKKAGKALWNTTLPGTLVNTYNKFFGKKQDAQLNDNGEVVYDAEGNIITDHAGMGDGGEVVTGQQQEKTSFWKKAGKALWNTTLPGTVMNIANKFVKVPVVDENGNIVSYTMKNPDDVTEIEGFTSDDITVPSVSNNTQVIPQLDENGNVVSYTTVDKNSNKGFFSKLKSGFSNLFGIGTATAATTTGSVDNSSSVTNNTGDTYNTTTNEIDTSIFGTLNETINKWLGKDDEDGKTTENKDKEKTTENKDKEKTTEEENKDKNEIIDIPWYTKIWNKVTGKDDDPNNPPGGSGQVNKLYCRLCGKPIQDCTCDDNNGANYYIKATCTRCGNPVEKCICNGNGGSPTKPSLLEKNKEKINNAKKTGKDILNKGAVIGAGILNKGKEIGSNLLKTGKEEGKELLSNPIAYTIRKNTEIQDGIWNGIKNTPTFVNELGDKYKETAMYDKFVDIGDSISGGAQKAKTALNEAGKKIVNNKAVKTVMNEAKELGSNPLAYTMNKGADMIDGTWSGIKKIYSTEKDLLNKSYEVAGNALDKAKNSKIVKSAKNKLKEETAWVTEGFEEGDSAGTKTGKVIQNIIKRPGEKKDEMLEKTEKYVKTAIGAVGKMFTSVWSTITKKYEEIKDAIEEGFTKGLDKIKEAFKFITKEIPKKIGEIKDNIVNGFTTAINNVKTSLSNMVDSIKNTFSKDNLERIAKEKITEIKNAFGNIGSSFSKIGEDIKNAINNVTSNFKLPEISLEGIKLSVQEVWTFIKDLGKQLISGGKISEEDGVRGSSDTKPLDQQLKPKNYVFRADDYQYNEKDSGKTVGGLSDKGNTHNFPFYAQADNRWGNEKLMGGDSMGDAGCGPTSAAMVLTHLTGERITPDTMARAGGDLLSRGYTPYNYFPEIASKFKMNYSEIESNDVEGLKAKLRNGQPVLLSGIDKTKTNATPYSDEGHMVVATGIKGDKVEINDPRGPGYSGSYSISNVMKGLKRGIVLTPSRATGKVGLPTSGFYSTENQMNNDMYENNEDLPVNDTENMESMGKDVGQIRLWEKVVGYAKAFKEKLTYVFGSKAIDKNGMTTDCSGFTKHVFDRCGVPIPAGSAYQKGAGVGVDPSQAQAGDLVVWNGHVGLVIDSNKNMIDAGSGAVPKIRSYETDYWRSRGQYVIRRVLDDPNKMVSAKVDNYHTGIGFSGIVDPQGGDIAGGGGSSGPQASLDKVLLVGDSLGTLLDPYLVKKYPNAQVRAKGGEWSKYWLDNFSQMPDAESVSTVIDWTGVNGVHDMTNNLSKSKELLNKLKEKYSGVPILKMRVFPTTKDAQFGTFSGEKTTGLVNEYNSEMSSWVGSNGIGYIDATNGLITSDGYLDSSIAKQDGIHIYGEDNNKVLANIESAINTYNSNNSGTNGTTTGTSTPQVEEMGIFAKFQQIAKNMVASIYNGKEVDLFATQTTTDTTTQSTTGDGTTPDISDISDNAAAMWKFFTGKGFTGQATAGIMGNLKQESGLDPTIKQYGGGPGRGIAQWTVHEERFKGLEAHAKSKGKDWTDLQSQLEWLDMELQGKDATTLNYLKKYVGGYEQFKAITDVRQATKVFEDSFERAGKPNMTNRYNAAESYYSQFSNAGMGPATATAAETSPTDGSIPDSMNGWKFYQQSDPKWGGQVGNSTVSAGGCGPTSAAMMLSTIFGQQINPLTMTKWAHANGTWTGAMQWSMPDKVSEDFGLSMTTLAYKDGGASAEELQSVKDAIKSGKPVIMTGRGAGARGKNASMDTPFTPTGHVVLGVGVDGSGNIIINDPRGANRTKAYTDDGILNIGTGLRGAWAFDTNGGSIPDSISSDGTFTPGSNTGGTTTGGTTTTSVEEMGLFAELEKIGHNLIASIYNGKEVDMYATTAATTDGTTPTTGTIPVGDTTVDEELMLSSQEGFFTALGPSAAEAYNQYHVFPSTTLAQAAHESAWGKSRVATTDKNLFGVKWTGKFAPGINVTQGLNCPAGEQGGARPYNRYESYSDSMVDHGWFLGKYDRYKPTLNATTPEQQIIELGKSGYAEDKGYASKLQGYVDKYNLTKYNSGSTSTNTSTTDNAGMGDGNTYLVSPKPRKHISGHAGMGDGKVSYNKSVVGNSGINTTNVETQREIENINRKINIAVNNINTSDPTSYTQILKLIMEELRAINNNTAATATGVKEIKIVSANEPISTEGNGLSTAQTYKSSKHSNSSLQKINTSTGYETARQIASYRK